MKFIQIIQIVVAILLIISILLQNRGAGLSSFFGGAGNVYMAKRGIEKTLFVSTIVFAVMFFSLALAGMFLAKS
jgi:protein translocase SecG subunit